MLALFVLQNCLFCHLSTLILFIYLYRLSNLSTSRCKFNVCVLDAVIEQYSFLLLLLLLGTLQPVPNESETGD